MIWQRFSSWPFVDKRKLQSPLQFSAALRVLRGQMCCRCSSSWSFVALRGQKSCLLRPVAVLRKVFFVSSVDKGVAVLALRCSSPRPSVALRGQMCCRCSSPRPSVSSADKMLQCRCSSSRPSVALPWTNVLPLQFSAALRGWTNVLPLQFSAALRGWTNL